MSPLAAHYDGLLLDLDGTVYRGQQAVPHAREALVAATAAANLRVLYVTNNASRSAVDVAEHLRELGFSASTDDVVTSAQAAVRLLAARVPARSKVFVVGTKALVDEVRAVGLLPVTSADAAPAAVVQGHSPATDWSMLAEAALAIRAGAVWVAANLDATLPTERGLLPGNGSMVAALRTATGQVPVVAGKPERPLMDDAVERGRLLRPLAVGDRLDTDVAGAYAAGLDSLLVLTGVSTVFDLVAAPAALRPTYLGADLRVLTAEVDALRIEDKPGWLVTVEDGTLTVECSDVAADVVDGARAVVASAWRSAPVRQISAQGAGAVAALEWWCAHAGVVARRVSEVSASVVLDE
jgi:glycerol 3-phosphatase-2